MATASKTSPTPTPKKSRAAKTPAPAGLDDPKAAQRAAGLFRMGGDATRVRILGLLTDGARNVTDISAAIGQSQPACSHHLALLRHGRIIEYKREGKNNMYALTTKGRLLAEILDRATEEDLKS
jgi:ArsR family transcriptional regulator, zinc-responsive transcriptional repressor